jgi:hypothetical protein
MGGRGRGPPPGPLPASLAESRRTQSAGAATGGRLGLGAPEPVATKPVKKSEPVVEAPKSSSGAGNTREIFPQFELVPPVTKKPRKTQPTKATTIANLAMIPVGLQDRRNNSEDLLAVLRQNRE